MKKNLLCLLSLILIFAVIPNVIVGAENAPVITVGNATAKRGETVNIQLSIDDNPGILAMAFCVSYDASALEYVTYQEGYLSNYNIKNHSDKGWISFVNVEESDCDNNDTLLTLTFKIKEEISDGKYEIGILNNNPEKYGESLHNSFANAKEQFIVPTVVKGYVNIIDFIKGDVNGDGTINSRDAALLMQYSNGWEVTIVEAAADVNADNQINSRDYALLMQYINGWDVEFK